MMGPLDNLKSFKLPAKGASPAPAAAKPAHYADVAPRGSVEQAVDWRPQRHELGVTVEQIDGGLSIILTLPAVPVCQVFVLEHTRHDEASIESEGKKKGVLEPDELVAPAAVRHVGQGWPR